MIDQHLVLKFLWLSQPYKSSDKQWSNQNITYVIFQPKLFKNTLTKSITNCIDCVYTQQREYIYSSKSGRIFKEKKRGCIVVIETFKAFVIDKDESGKVTPTFKQLSPTDLPKGMCWLKYITLV